MSKQRRLLINALSVLMIIVAIWWVADTFNRLLVAHQAPQIIDVVPVVLTTIVLALSYYGKER